MFGYDIMAFKGLEQYISFRNDGKTPEDACPLALKYLSEQEIITS